MSKDLKIIKISDLPESKRVQNTYFFGYDPDNENDKQSVKIPFSEIARASNERRIAVVMETDTQIIPVGEKMTLYRATGNNLSALYIKPNDINNDNWMSVNIGSDIQIDLSSYTSTDAIIRIEKPNTVESQNKAATVYLFTKVIIE
ncbi:hypothetical protein [Dysgonomonas macrotermitis]|uniref:Uncharacterized protein n=1 Tax=Dysgonomonas macrotermitis TaxID=1346286 RepID=A0A1M5HBR4_9BACT|nr:hypothetical protein [Dysgonomonas macrotermitis]SHG13376.1 hypothetical protein SAMN05444362_11614 [Dysgonomonas macrotermitis]